MVMVDSSVWINLLIGKDTRQTHCLSLVIENLLPLCTCGIVMAEVLQGCRDNRLYREIRDVLSDLVYMQFTKDLFIQAADIYRSLRKKGITIRKPVDCMIASVCIEHGLELLHDDRDFTTIAGHTGLKILDK